MTPMDSNYEQILDPISLVKNFPTMEHFIDWIEEGSILDLKELKTLFKEHGLIEHVVVIEGMIFKKSKLIG